MTGTDRRNAVLDEIRKLVCADRQKTYGDAEDNFRDIADLLNVVLRKKLRTELDSLDVALISCCIKLSRCGKSPRHIDNLVDLAGYGVCGAGIVKSEQENVVPKSSAR